MHAHPGGGQLFADVAPPGAALQRELASTIWAVLSQPGSQRLARRRTNLTPAHQPVTVDVIERDLLSVHVQTAYHRHRDLLELLKHFSDAHINERLCRGGPPIHMSSFDFFGCCCSMRAEAAAHALRPASVLVHAAGE